MTVASVYTGFYATSSPLNPGSNNSGVWEITASSFLDSNRNAYKAFDEDLNPIFYKTGVAARETIILWNGLCQVPMMVWIGQSLITL